MFASLTKIVSSDQEVDAAYVEHDIDAKSPQVSAGTDFAHGDALKLIHPDGLHVGT